MIDFDDVGFSYDGTTFVLDGISLRIEPGEYVCILGGNGSGKSTLAKHINALLVPDTGSVHVFGADTADDANLYFIRSNAGMVFQNPDDQIVASLVENDVAFGPENLGLPADQLRERVTSALRQVGLQGFELSETSALSGGQKQRVAIAGVLAMDPKVLVLDEASAMLDPRGRAGLLRVCRELNDSGMTIVMITHFMEEATEADRVFVLDEGRVSAQGSPKQVLCDIKALEARSLDVPFAARAAYRLERAGIGLAPCTTKSELVDELSRVLGEGKAGSQAANASSQEDPGAVAGNPATGGSVSADSPCAPEAEELVRFENVSFAYGNPRKARRKSRRAPAADWGNDPDQPWALHDIDFNLREGEFFGIAGHTGSGKSTLLQLMNGLLRPTHGRVLVQGRDIADKAEATWARRHVGLVFQYPEHQLFATTVFEDVAFGPRKMGVSEADAEQRYLHAMELVGLDAERLREMSPFELSGGQQRRVAFAGVLAMEPRTLILDEPAAGLDPRGHRELLGLIEGFHEQGITVAMASHNMDDLARLCDRILVLNQGTQHMLGTPVQVFGDAAACKAIGLDVPSAQSVANALAQRGVVLPAPKADSGEAKLFDLQSLVGAALRVQEGRA